jgi:peptide/nickel transport system permease protein
VLPYVVRRLLLLVPILLVVGTVVFALIHLTPGDPAALILGSEASPEQVIQLRARLGLNDPIPTQFVRWFTGVLRLDFGDSLFIGKPVMQALLDRAQPTALLTLYALSLSVLVGVGAGIVAAVWQGSWLDRALMAMAISGTALPSFFVSILFILAFAVVWRWLPSGGFVEITENPVAHFRTMVMPSCALALSSAGLLARLVRSSMLEVLREDFIRTAQAKGLPTAAVVVRHAFRNALIPAITVIGYSLGGLLGGAVVTETVFNLPGMGRLVVQSIARRDLPVIQGAVMLTAGFYVLSNLLVDVLYAYADPRIRYGAES